MESKFGFPIVNAENIFEVLKERRITVWPYIQPPMSLEDYAAGNLTETQQEEIRRFAPKSEVVFPQDPKGNPFTGFRSVGKNWVSVFTILGDNLLPIVAEYKHGAHTISIGFPSGVPGRKESDFKDPMSACAKREFLEETGIELEDLVLLSAPEGIPISGRQSTQRFFPFLGILPESIHPQPKLDSTEFLQVLLIPLKEWVKLIEQGKVTEDSSISLTFLALLRLSRLKIK